MQAISGSVLFLTRNPRIADGRVFEMVTIQTFTDDLFQPYHLAVVVRDLSISRQQEKKIELRIRNLSSSAGSAHFVTVGWSLNL